MREKGVHVGRGAGGSGDSGAGGRGRFVMRKALPLLIVLLVAGPAAWLLWPRGVTPPPDAESAPPEEVHRYVASDDFVRLAPEEQGDYLEKLWNQPSGRVVELMQVDHLPKKTRAKITRHVRQAMYHMVVKNARECSGLSVEEQDAYVDEKIEQMMAVATKSMLSGQGRPRFGPPWMQKRPSGDRIQKAVEQMLSETSPQERALLAQYHQRIRKRFLNRMGWRE